MDGNALLQFFQNNLTLIETIVPTVSATLFTSLFLRYNTRTTELEKLRAQKFDELSEELIKLGKMTHMEYFHWNRYFKIAKIADKHLKQNGLCNDDPTKYEFEWFIRFYEYAGKISNSDMQQLWGKLLAGELNKPGSVSYSLLHALYMMRKEEALTFANACRFILNGYDGRPHLFLYLSSAPETYNARNLTTATLSNFQRLGLVVCDFHREYVFQHKDRNARFRGEVVRKSFRSGNNKITISSTEKSNQVIKAGNVVLTPDGEMLYTILDDEFKRHSDSNLDFIVSMLERKGCLVQINDTYTTKFT